MPKPNPPPQCQDFYRCGQCGSQGVKLWRPYNAFDVRLRCSQCLGFFVGRHGLCHRVGRSSTDHCSDKQLGAMVPAVPTADASADWQEYWGYTAVPLDRVDWWRNLPDLPVGDHAEA